MTAKLTVILKEYHPLQRNDLVNDTKVRFISDDDLNCDELFAYFIRSALAFGFMMDSIKDTIMGLAEEYSDIKIVPTCGSSDKDALLDILRKEISESI